MNRMMTLVATTSLLAAAVACQRESSDVDAKLDKIATRLEAMDKKIDQIQQQRPAAGRPGPAQGEPDPKAVYAVPVAADDYPKGPATAKVTVVEAADFA